MSAMSEQEEFEFRKRLEDEQRASAPMPSPVPEPESSALEAFGKGAINNAALGLLPKISGAIESPTGALKEAGQYIGIKADQESPDVKSYLMAKLAKEKELDRLQEQHPYAYGTGAVVGTLGMPVPAIAKLPSLGGRIAASAGLGGVMGLARSNANNPNEAIHDIAVPAATSAVLTPAIEKAVPYVQKGLGWAGKKALNVFADTPEELTEGYLANPEAYNNALSQEGVAQKIADTVGDLRKDTGPATEQALSTLSHNRADSTVLSVQDALDYLKNANTGNAEQLSKEILENYQQRLSDVSPHVNADFLTEREIHDVKRVLQEAAKNWNAPLSSDVSRAASGEINNALKTGNTDYAQAMEPLAQNIQSKKALAQKFGIQPDFSGANESGFTYSDRTLSALKDILRDNKVDRKRILESIRQQGYGDLADDVEKSLGKAYFEGAGRTNGSRKAVMGATVGGAIGHFTGIPGGGFTGSAIGGAVGGALDKYSPQIAKKALDATVLVKQLSQTPGGQRFVGVIKNAAAKGPAALAATHFILSQTEPSYQDATQQQQ